MDYCSACGRPVRVGIPEGDTHPRHLCDHCGAVHYQNPKIIVGCLPVWQDRVLLCKRSIEPRNGYWTLPSGFMENGETLEEGAIRETREEALAEVILGRLFSVYSLPNLGQVYFLFLADLIGPDFGAGAETEETALLAPAEIPWDRIAFRAVEFALRRFVDPEARAAQACHSGFWTKAGDAWIDGS